MGLDLHFASGLLDRPLAEGTTLQDALAQLAADNADVHQRLLANTQWPLGWLDLPDGNADAEASIALAQRTAEQYDALVVCGIGGSALGTQAVYGALNHAARPLREVYVLDNVDPTQVAALSERFDTRRTAINVISKSGTTLETMAGFLHLLDLLESNGGAQPGQVVATTDASKGLLRELADERGWPTLPVPGDVGGRFSVLTPVGLFPLAFAGVDVPALLNGAAEAQRVALAQPTDSDPWRLAALHYLLHMQGGCCVTVQYVYGDPLVLLGDWFRQLWAESLAKAAGASGGACLTPVVARGTTDQHSQNQLFMEGPDDKLYGFVSATEWPQDVPVGRPTESGADGGLMSRVGQLTFCGILEACRFGTRDALIEAGRPVYELTLGRCDAGSIGAYLQTWMLATAWAGLLYGVNPFDQPGVQRSKVITNAQLGL